ncbi:hypothetical protein HDU67_003919 [Dinochytrium kinnereticum]|nr:hypothetical protein HDU67_003919 [Dinochytrium kinnereticum]
MTSAVELRHFNLLRCVGKGAFGKVRIVEKRDTKKLYALKYINKLQCIRMRAIQNIFRERAILEDIHHPLIVNLRFAFQDDDNMFMVIDLMMGGDLRYHLDRLGGFQESAVRFMAAELCSAVAYLHEKSIVHRDLKPDNAPDIFRDRGYLWQIDWWSLGIVLYELLYGKRDRPNFDATYDLEELLLEDNPLTYRPRKKKTIRNAAMTAAAQAHMASHSSSHPTPNASDNGANRTSNRAGQSDGPPTRPQGERGSDGPNHNRPQGVSDGQGSNGVPLPPALANSQAYQALSVKDRTAVDLQFIEDFFRNFDSTVYERYPGIIDPTTLGVGDPPAWVVEAGKGGGGEGESTNVMPATMMGGGGGGGGEKLQTRSAGHVPQAYNFDGDAAIPPPQSTRHRAHPPQADPKPIRKGTLTTPPPSFPLTYTNPVAADAAFTGLPPTSNPTSSTSSTPSLSFASKLVRRVSRSGSAPPSAQTSTTSLHHHQQQQQPPHNPPPVPKLPQPQHRPHQRHPSPPLSSSSSFAPPTNKQLMMGGNGQNALPSPPGSPLVLEGVQQGRGRNASFGGGVGGRGAGMGGRQYSQNGREGVVGGGGYQGFGGGR